jgi:hypothetical protein
MPYFWTVAIADCYSNPSFVCFKQSADRFLSITGALFSAIDYLGDLPDLFDCFFLLSVYTEDLELISECAIANSS